MPIHEINCTMPMRSVGDMKGYYDIEFRKPIVTKRFQDTSEKLNTEELEKKKDVIVKSDFNQLLRIEQRDFKSKLSEQMEIFYNQQKQLMEKYSEYFLNHGNEIVSSIMRYKDVDADGTISPDEAGEMSDKIFRHDTNEDGLIDKEELFNGLEEIFLFDHRKNLSKLEDILASINGAPADKYSKVPDSSHIKSVA